MAGTTGLEPATSAVTGQRSNQLNYVPSAGREAPGKLASGGSLLLCGGCPRQRLRLNAPRSYHRELVRGQRRVGYAPAFEIRDPRGYGSPLEQRRAGRIESEPG